jgi:hypothetical protein
MQPLQDMQQEEAQLSPDGFMIVPLKPKRDVKDLVGDDSISEAAIAFVCMDAGQPVEDPADLLLPIVACRALLTCNSFKSANAVRQWGL